MYGHCYNRSFFCWTVCLSVYSFAACFDQRANWHVFHVLTCPFCFVRLLHVLISGLTGTFSMYWPVHFALPTRFLLYASCSCRFVSIHVLCCSWNCYVLNCSHLLRGCNQMTKKKKKKKWKDASNWLLTPSQPCRSLQGKGHLKMILYICTTSSLSLRTCVDCTAGASFFDDFLSNLRNKRPFELRWGRRRHKRAR